MPRWLGFGAIVLSLLLVQGCSSLRKAAGLDKRAPDEFAVVTRAPLIVPPDFDLRPPVPGATRPNVNTPSEQARATLTGRTVTPAASTTTPATFDEPRSPTNPSSPGQEALLARTGAAATDPNIRREISQEQEMPVPVDPALFTRLIQAPASSDATPTVVERRETPIDLVETTQ